jgi:hypothetical protein
LACRNDGFDEAVKRKAPNVVVVSADDKLTPDAWLEYYAVMFAMIAQYKATYGQAKVAADTYLSRTGRELSAGIEREGGRA